MTYSGVQSKRTSVEECANFAGSPFKKKFTVCHLKV